MKFIGIVMCLISLSGINKANACGVYVAPHDPGGSFCSLASFDMGQICVHGKCSTMTSNSTKTIFVPFNTSAEWISFYLASTSALTISQFCEGYGIDGVACGADAAVGCEFYFNFMLGYSVCGTCVEAGTC
jgi:hypothetical protein